MVQFSVPELGTFQKQRYPARIDESKGINIPEYETLTFVPFSFPFVQAFVQFLANSQKITPIQATNLAEETGKEIKLYLNQFKSLDIPPHGTLKLINLLGGETLQFERPLPSSSQFTSPAGRGGISITSNASFSNDIHIRDSNLENSGFTAPKQNTNESVNNSSEKSSVNDYVKDVSGNDKFISTKRKYFRKNILILFFGIIGIGLLIILTYFRKDIQRGLGMGKHPVNIEYNDIDPLFSEATEGDSLMEIRSISDDEMDSLRATEDYGIDTQVDNDIYQEDENEDEDKLDNPDDEASSSDELNNSNSVPTNAESLTDKNSSKNKKEVPSNLSLTYHIIVKACKSLEEATSESEKWKSKGFTTEKIPITGNSETKFRISVFADSNSKKVETTLKELKKSGKIPSDSWILKRKMK